MIVRVSLTVHTQMCACKQAGIHAQYFKIYIYILCYQNSNDSFAKPITNIKNQEHSFGYDIMQHNSRFYDHYRKLLYM